MSDCRYLKIRAQSIQVGQWWIILLENERKTHSSKLNKYHQSGLTHQPNTIISDLWAILISREQALKILCKKKVTAFQSLWKIPTITDILKWFKRNEEKFNKNMWSAQYIKYFQIDEYKEIRAVSGLYS